MIINRAVRTTGYLPPFLRNLLKQGHLSHNGKKSQYPTPRGVFELQVAVATPPFVAAYFGEYLN